MTDQIGEGDFSKFYINLNPLEGRAWAGPSEKLAYSGRVGPASKAPAHRSAVALQLRTKQQHNLLYSSQDAIRCCFGTKTRHLQHLVSSALLTCVRIILVGRRL